MKYGESIFDILYLLFAIVSGIVILTKARNRTEKLTGLSALILGCSRLSASPFAFFRRTAGLKTAAI